MMKLRHPAPFVLAVCLAACSGVTSENEGQLALNLEMLQDKRDTVPSKKHGCIPL